MVNIEKDNRHSEIKYLLDEKVESRGFQDWNMDAFHLGAGQTFSKDLLIKLAADFKKTLLPKSDMFAYYLKTLLKQDAR